MKRISINNFHYEVPDTWYEITTKQLLYLIRLTKEPISVNEMQLKFLLYCIGGRTRSAFGSGLYQVKTRQANHFIFADEMAALLEVFDYMIEERDGKKYLTTRLTRNPYKKIRSGLKRLRGPQDLLDDITYNQFVLLQTYQAQMSDDNPQAIDEFVNVLFKTRKGNHDVKNVRRLPEDVKTVMLWLYLGTLAFLEDRFPRVFSGGDTENANVFDAQQRIIDMMAGGDVTKKNQVRESLLYDALYSMEMAAVRMEEMDKKRKN